MLQILLISTRMHKHYPGCYFCPLVRLPEPRCESVLPWGPVQSGVPVLLLSVIVFPCPTKCISWAITYRLASWPRDFDPITRTSSPAETFIFNSSQYHSGQVTTAYFSHAVSRFIMTGPLPNGRFRPMI